jgi:exosome complex component CSL4
MNKKQIAPGEHRPSISYHRCEDMNVVAEENAIVMPGDALGSADTVCAGSGTYELNGVVRSSLCGKVVFDLDAQKKRRVNVVTRRKKASDFVIDVGDKVFCRVLRSNNNQVFVDILAVGESVLPFPCKGVIRREDISEKEADSIVIYERFKGGDVVKAAVISLGDSKQYFLSTATPGLGLQVR